MSTPMQKMIDWVNDYPSEATTINKSAIIAKAKELREEEKEVIFRLAFIDALNKRHNDQ